MLDILKIDHVGIRVRDKDRAVQFYELLGFGLIADAGFDRGHPVIMRHPGGVVINLLGPADQPDGPNILMEERYAGFTHISLRVTSLDSARSFFDSHDIPITGAFEFKGLLAIFVRDPDNNVIEFDEYTAEEPETRLSPDTDFSPYSDHL